MKHLFFYFAMISLFVMSCDNEEFNNTSIVGTWEGDRIIIRHPLDVPTAVDTSIYFFKYDFREDETVIIEDLLRRDVALIDTLSYKFDSNTKYLYLIRGDLNEPLPELNMPVLALIHFKVTKINDLELHILENTELFNWGESTYIKVENILTKK